MSSCRVAVNAKTFGGIRVLDPLEFVLEAGSFTGLVGPSGAGKSTLLNIISGLDPAFDGRLEWQGGRRRIGYLFQEPRLMPWLSVRENMELVMARPTEEREWIDHLLDMVGLVDRAKAFPAQLSGGMQRRVALARAMAIRPDLLLLDEPFASLDEPTAAGLRQLVLALWREQSSAILLVTHNLREALELADEILFLSNGPARIVHREPLSPSRLDPRVNRDAELLERQLMRSHPAILAGEATQQEVP